MLGQLVELTDEELAALEAQRQAAAQEVPPPPPYDPAQDTQGMQAQPATYPETAPAAAWMGPDVPAETYSPYGGTAPAESTTQTIAPAPPPPVPEPEPAAPYGPPAEQGYQTQLAATPTPAPAATAPVPG